jgi:hypothetical protein
MEAMMDHTEYEVGQTWHSDRGNWKRVWSIAEVDRRKSVTLLRVDPHPVSNSNAKWISSGLFADIMEKYDAQRVA